MGLFKREGGSVSAAGAAVAVATLAVGGGALVSAQAMAADTPSTAAEVTIVTSFNGSDPMVCTFTAQEAAAVLPPASAPGQAGVVTVESGLFQSADARGAPGSSLGTPVSGAVGEGAAAPHGSVGINVVQGGGAQPNMPNLVVGASTVDAATAGPGSPPPDIVTIDLATARHGTAAECAKALEQLKTMPRPPAPGG